MKLLHFSTSLSLLTTLMGISGSAIAQTTPITGDLSVSGDIRGGGLLVLYGTAPVAISTGNQGPGTRVLWYGNKAAFRAGKVDGMQWSDANLGQTSTAFGRNTTASGSYSTAFGYGTIATGLYSMATGYFTTAPGYNSIALGGNTLATGTRSMASGFNSSATGLASMASGYSTIATGDSSNATGRYTLASGASSAAMGQNTIANSCASVAIGRLNVGEGDPVNWNPGDSLFEIGNGTLDASYEDDLDGDGEYEYHSVPAVPSNALTVYKNGNMDVQGVVTCAPGGDIPMFTGN